MVAPRLSRSLLIFAVPVLLTGAFCHVYRKGALLSCPPQVPVGLLLVVLPTLFYLCLVRPHRWPVLTVGSAWGVAAGLCYWLFPPAQYAWLSWTGYLAGGLEVVALAYLLWNIRSIRRNYQRVRHGEPDFLTAMERAVRPVAGRATIPLLSEVALVRYALLGSWAAPETEPDACTFSYHQDSGFGAVLVVGIVMLVIESSAAHLVLSRWSSAAAGLWLVLDIYALLWLLAHRQAIRLRPVLVTDTELTLRVGFVWHLRIPRNVLDRVELISDAPTPQTSLLNAAKPLLTTPNLLLTLAQPLSAEGAYGIKRSVNRISLYVDNYKELYQKLQAETTV